MVELYYICAKNAIMHRMTERELQKLKEDIVIETALRDFPFTFITTWGIFSPKAIDEGTELLIKHLDVKPEDKVLDLGCGYGPVGLTMAKLAPQGKIHMIDTNIVAINYARKNARANQCNHCHIYLSNGFQQVETKEFDVIASNLPAKINKELFLILLHDAKRHLKPGGKLYVVTISGLKEFIKRNFQEIFGNYEKLAQNKGYIVAMAEK